MVGENPRERIHNGLQLQNTRKSAGAQPNRSRDLPGGRAGQARAALETKTEEMGLRLWQRVLT